MAFKLFKNNESQVAAARGLVAAIVAIGIACGSVAFAANNSV